MIFPLIAAGFLYVANAQQPTVFTAEGGVRGFTIDTQSGEKADVFLGIPYAQPPVGDLRFEKPLPAKPWNTPINATTWGHECVPHTLKAVVYEVDEDCLTVNIIRPQKRSRIPHPVLLWVHGGGYEIGSARLYGYQGFADAFAHREIIVVTLQYRIGVYGFLSTGDKELPGNLGLWDLTLGLKWAHENIIAFGGDPNKITLWGLSAGGAAVNQLILSPHSRNYVASAVEMSGSAFASWAIGPNVVNSSRSLISELGCEDDTKSCLKSKTIKEMNEAVEAVGYTTQDMTIIKWGPRIDGDFFPSTPDVLVKDAPPKPILMGVSDKDSSFFTVMGKSVYIQSFLASKDLYSFKEEEMAERIRGLITKSAKYEKKEAYDKVVEHYLEGKNNADEAFYLNKYTEFITDTMFNAAAVEGAEARIKANWPVWIYSFDHYNDAVWENVAAPKGVRGSFHINEFTYMFDLKLLAQWEYSQADIVVKENIRDALAKFAKSGVPVWKGTNWPRATEKLEYLIMKEHAEVKEDYHGDAIRFWRSMENFGFDAITMLPVEQKGHEEL